MRLTTDARRPAVLHPVETKVTAAAAAAYVSTAAVVWVAAAGQGGQRIVDGLPDAVTALCLAVGPAALTFWAGWKAGHTPRMGR